MRPCRRPRAEDQPEDGDTTEIGRDSIGGQARLKRPYLRISVVVAIAAGVIGLGYFGPHPAPAVTANASPTLGLSTQESAAPSASVAPLATGVESLTALTSVVPQAGQLNSSKIQGSLTGSPPAVIGLSLFYVVNGNRIESTVIGSPGSTETLVKAQPCETFSGVVAAGNYVGYVSMKPVEVLDGLTACSGGKTAWSIWVLDLDTRTPRRIAAGTVPAGPAPAKAPPVHLALTPAALAFNRPSSDSTSQDQAVEVHSLDGRLLWTSPASSQVEAVMLGGDRLAFVTDGAPLVEGLLILWESSAVRPLPRQIAQPLSSAALSSDGSYLAWDLPPEPDRPASNRQSAVVIENLDTGRVGFVWTQTASGAPRPLTPAIASTPAGALVAWFASTPGGAVYPAFRFSYRSAGAVFANTSEPLWIGVEDGTLLWLAQGADSASVVAYALDVSNLGPA